MKRSIISMMCMAAAIVLAASCNKIEDNPIAPGRTVITAVAEQIGAGTKVEMAYLYDALWQTGDQIHVKQGQTTDTFTLVDGVGTTKGTFKGTKSISGEIEAFYPVGVGETMEWPATQNNNQVDPMYAKQSISGTENETVNFSSLGAILQIVFNSTTPDITVNSITIKDVAKPLSGKFTVDNNGQAIIDDGVENVGITLDLGTGVQMGKSAKYFYIAIPAGNYKGDEITLTFTDSNSGAECVMTSSTFPNIERNTVGRVTLSGSFKGKVPTGALPGKFTVDMEGKQVYFSKGNLQATYHTSTGSYSWGFADNQWDCNYEGNTTIGVNQTDGAIVDLFCWSSPATYYGIATIKDRDKYPGDFVDWGTAYCEDYKISPDDTWRTLSTNEWQYLLDNNKHGWATVKYDNGKEMGGMVIAPDDYEGTISSIYEAYHLSESNLVFLPAASSRDGLSVIIDKVGERGHYHSGTQMTSYSAYGLYFYDDYDMSFFMHNRSQGCSVRLVTDVNYTPAVQRRYTVPFYSGHDATVPASFMSDAGATIAKPEDPTAPGYVFDGWYKEYNNTTPWDFDKDIVTRDIVLFAKWK